MSVVLEVPPDLHLRCVSLNLDHAVLELGPGGLEHVSNAVALRFGPRR